MATSKEFRLTETKTKTPAMSAGGGGYTNTYTSQVILSQDKQLKKCLFVKTAGHLACSTDQVIIPIEINDLVISLKGTIPASDLNPDAEITGWKITKITDQYAIGEKTEITHSEIPPCIITGTERYHNRDGTYFCQAPENAQFGGSKHD